MTDALTPGLLHRLPEPPRKVALVRPSRMGDFICAIPAFRALRAALPDAEISMITLPILRELAERLPYFDRYIPFPGYPGLAEQFFDARRAAAFFQTMQAEEFDLAIQMQGSGVNSNPFTLMLGARATAGWVRPGDPPGCLDAALPLPEEGHEIERVLSLTTFLGVPPKGLHTEFPLWEEDHRAAEALLRDAKPPFIGIHPAARALTRRWSLERFAEVGRTLQEQHGGTVVIVCEVEERAAADFVGSQIDGPCLNLAGQTPLAALGAVIARLSVLLTNDTGPAHIAYALGTPAVTVWGGGEIDRYRALQSETVVRIAAHPVDCRPCYYHECPYPEPCLERVSAAQVIEAARAIMR